VRTLFDGERELRSVSAADIERCKQGPQAAFWLDIEAPDDDDLRLLQESFHFHPLTIEDIQHQDQRPKLDNYDGYDFAVLMVGALSGATVSFREHHLFIAPRYVVTVHDQPEPSFQTLHERVADSPGATRRAPGFLAYLVMDVLVDATFGALEQLDESVDRLQDAILENASTQHLVELQELKHGVTEMRRVLGAQRDMFTRLVTHSLDKYDPETTAYYRDVYDHMLLQYESVDSLRDLLTGAMDVYLSMVSNRLNMTMKALTVIASVFLPLTFLTGFFGMNFGWLVSRIAGFEAFAIGLSVMLVSIVFQLWLFRRRGWI
jgi:magnesium transporter